MKKSLDKKLANMRDGSFAQKDFIIADAKDADMAHGVNSCGLRPDGTPMNVSEYRENMRKIIKQKIVDIMLMSASSLEVLSAERIFDYSPMTPAARANDTSDIWICRGGNYATHPSRPFSSAEIDDILKAGANLGLYSTTFNNNLDADFASLEAFKRFRKNCAEKKFRYFWEVFNPNTAKFESSEAAARFVNDCITRTLAGVVSAQRPQFLKVAYNGARAMEELASYDTSMPVGILGGGAGTTHDAFKLLCDAQKYGARVALFGRKINNAEDQLSFVSHLRAVADGNISPLDAVKSYHGELEKKKIKAKRSLQADLEITETSLSYGG